MIPEHRSTSSLWCVQEVCWGCEWVCCIMHFLYTMSGAMLGQTFHGCLAGTAIPLMCHTRVWTWLVAMDTSVPDDMY